jgi:hypothetical protein
MGCQKGEQGKKEGDRLEKKKLIISPTLGRFQKWSLSNFQIFIVIVHCQLSLLLSVENSNAGV